VGFRKKESINEKEAPTYKARLVAKGFSQKEGVDYDEIFSPVVKHTSIQVLLSLITQLNMELKQLDVKTAFFLEIWRKQSICLSRKDS